MPRPNQHRTIAGESALARRVAQERERRNLSYEALAIQMRHRGCPINASALFRIEKGDPPRRITVDELLAFARVFNQSPERMLLAPEVVAREDVVELLNTWQSAGEEARRATERQEAAATILQAKAQTDPGLAPILESVLSEWAAEQFEEEHRPGAVAYQMWAFTKSDEWLERARAEVGGN